MAVNILCALLIAWAGESVGLGAVPHSPVFQQPVPYVKMPEKVEVQVGRLGRIKIETNGKTIRWIVPPELDSFREFDPDPSVIRLIVVGYADGQYRLVAYTAIGDVPSDPAICVVVVGKGPGPVPPVPPGPDPPIPPIPIAGLRVLVVYESATPGDTAKIVGSATVRDYLNAKCAKGPDGKSPEYRILDKDVSLANASQWVKDAMARQRQSMPWIVVSNGTAGFEGPLPTSIDATMTLLKKFGG